MNNEIKDSLKLIEDHIEKTNLLIKNNFYEKISLLKEFYPICSKKLEDDYYHIELYSLVSSVKISIFLILIYIQF